MNTEDGAGLVEICRAWGESEVRMIRGLLETHGIESAIRGESTRITHAFTLDGLAEVRILVRAQDVADASRILAATEGMTACPACGRPNSARDSACRYCSGALPTADPE